MDHGSRELDKGTREAESFGVDRTHPYQSNREVTREDGHLGGVDTERTRSKDSGGKDLSESDSWFPSYGRTQRDLGDYRFENCRGVVRSKIIAAASTLVAFIIFILPLVLDGAQ